MASPDPPTDCRELFARLSEYLDGELPPGTCEELQAHLARCPPCQAFARTLRRTVELCRQLPARPVSDDLRRELRACLERRGGR